SGVAPHSPRPCHSRLHDARSTRSAAVLPRSEPRCRSTPALGRGTQISNNVAREAVVGAKRFDILLVAWLVSSLIMLGSIIVAVSLPAIGRFLAPLSPTSSA